MKSGRPGYPRLTALFACLVACAFPALVSCRMPDSEFKAKLKKFDIQFAMGDIESAAALISRLKGGKSLQRLGSILKREYRLSLATGDTKRYAKAALEAAEAEGSLTLRALAAQALLADGRGAQARAALGSESSGPASGELTKLRLALSLARASEIDPDGGLSLGADFWAVLANGTGKAGYGFDAALCALRDGEKSRAALELKSCIDAGFPVPPEIAFDSGLYSECIASIDRRKKAGDLGKDGGSAYVRLEADAAVLDGDPERARSAWEDAIREFPYTSSVAWHNLAAVEKDPAKREELLSRAVSLYPADRGRILDLAAFYASRGMREAGIAAMGGESSMEDLSSKVPEALLVRLELDSIQAESAKVEASLLKAVSAREGDPELLRYAVFRLLGLKRHEAAFRLVLDADRDAAWTPFAEACLLSAIGKRAEAVDAFDACESEAVHYASLWNAAALLSRGRDWIGAGKRLEAAVGAAKDEKERALAYTFLGDCLESLGRRQEAKTAYLAALSQWPDCPDAGFALAGIKEDEKPSRIRSEEP